MRFAIEDDPTDAPPPALRLPVPSRIILSRPPSARRQAGIDAMRHERLLAVAVPDSSALATLALAAAAALCGIRADGAAFGPAAGRTTVAAIATELGFVRRASLLAAIDELELRGELVLLRRGVGRAAFVEVVPDALSRRWSSGCRATLPRWLRRCRLRAEALLVAAVAIGQAGRDGTCRLGRGALASATALPLRCLDRAIAAAVRAGALLKERRRARGAAWATLVLRAGPAAQSHDLSESGESTCSNPASHLSESGESACANPASNLSESGESPVRKRRTISVSPSPVQADGPRVRGAETNANPEQAISIARGWAAAHADDPCLTASAAEQLIALLEGPAPTELHEQFADARREAAACIARWCPSADRLARWVAVAARRYRPKSIAAFVVQSARRGDPQQLLGIDGGHGILGDAEAVLAGPYLAQVRELVEPPRSKLAAVPAPGIDQAEIDRVAFALARGDRLAIDQVAARLAITPAAAQAAVERHALRLQPLAEPRRRGRTATA